MKIVSIVGARPQFIKAAPVSGELRKYHQEKLLHTGQHYDAKLSKIFFDDLKIPRPDLNLGVGSDSHARQTAEIMIGVESYLIQQKPDWVIIYGDTNSTLAGALATTKLHIRLAHVEAGLRSFNRRMPEEINRIVADRVSNILFCPTTAAVKNLQREGVSAGVHLVGDVMMDAAQQFVTVAEQKSRILEKLSLQPKQYFLLTLHRAENTDSEENMRNIVDALTDSPEPIIFPVHPRTVKYLKQYKLFGRIQMASNIVLADPVSFMDMIVLEKNAAKILTDSGGVQKEAYFYGVPCITLRDETEWVETVADGWNCLVGANRTKITEAINNFAPGSPQQGHYGDGSASLKIRKVLENESS
ncbi:MAG TPA: UDP-N-acetylglucosamine 2-epimerase (non-hydrolyzing) [bacterium]|nr:UDP-N-acetylglucosamine 2-epimerase (non-hydrolyzing) [bacterium]